MGTSSSQEVAKTESVNPESFVSMSETSAVQSLRPGQMLEVHLTSEEPEVDSTSSAKKKEPTCLMLRDEEGRLRALGAKCTHYGASLAQGSYRNGVIRCPWHGACFNAVSGDIEDYPGLDSLPVFDVRVDEEGRVRVKATKEQLRSTKRRRAMCGHEEQEDQRVFVIVGGGAAAQTCAETLRQAGRFRGRIVMLTQEQERPYDRPKLSKALTSSASEIALREADFYEQFDIDLRLNSKVVNLDVANKSVHVEGGEKVEYDKLLLATGSSPRSLPIAEKKGNVFVLRTPNDGQSIVKAVGTEECHVVILGTSFIGMEVAAYLTMYRKKAKVTVVGRGSTPFKVSLGERVGKVLQTMHEKKGVQFVNKATIKDIITDSDNNVIEAVLDSGTILKADVLVLGLGATPNTEAFVKGVETTDQGFVEVNEYLETNVCNVFAAGDIAHAPLFDLDHKAAVGHWQLAHAHGRLAAINMAATDDSETRVRREALRTVPFFWTTQYGKSIRFAGYNGGYDDVIYDWKEDEDNNVSFVVYYLKQERVVAVATLNRDPIAAHFADALREGKRLLRDDVVDQKLWFQT